MKAKTDRIRRRWAADFFRGFFAALLVLGLTLGVLWGVNAARRATEAVCFGGGMPAWSAEPDTPSA